MITTEFKCPKCGSSCYGSARNKDGSLQRYCHSTDDIKTSKLPPCRFNFNEKDDWKYFKYDGKTFTSKPQYDLYKLREKLHIKTAKIT